MVVEDCLFCHGQPGEDPTDPVQFYTSGWPEEPEVLSRCLNATPQRVAFIGHYHRWLIGNSQGHVTWFGREPILLARPERWFVVVHAVANGWCARYDTDSGELKGIVLRR
jgi:hypothetical protein